MAFLSLKFPLSATYTVPFTSMATPTMGEKSTDCPVPSAYPQVALGDPAMVTTAPVVELTSLSRHPAVKS